METNPSHLRCDCTWYVFYFGPTVTKWKQANLPMQKTFWPALRPRFVSEKIKHTVGNEKEICHY